MYKKVDTSLDFVAREQEILEFWKEHNIFEQSVELNTQGEEYAFYDGPPTANGKPHIGHILTRVIKDIIPRYQTMKGKHVERKAGWDTHGLPVELEVEKVLGLDGKPDIERYGIEEFIKACKESVWKYKGEWEKLSARVGYFADMKNPYITYDDNYIESVWWALAEINKKGLLYKGDRIVPYCPRCGTSLSTHEMAQGYKEVVSTSAVVKFKVKGRENTYFLAWTTTPWTLPANSAICLNPDVEYAEVAIEKEIYILAKDRVLDYFTVGKLLSVQRGSAYQGIAYEPLFSLPKQKGKNDYIVVCDKFVSVEEGTGIVHIAPAFGEDDFRVGGEQNLAIYNLVDDEGRYKREVSQFAGEYAQDCNQKVLKNLAEKEAVLTTKEHKHSYPHCWRCDTKLIYQARKSWFIRVSAIREKLLATNATINWIPSNIKDGRMGKFLENAHDWSLSRDRYWGTPLPIWECKECGKKDIIGSKAELKEKCGFCEDIELHRPYIDKCSYKCTCGGTMYRVPEVIDCWFDSGSMPFAQFHYPFENVEKFEKSFPANFISEAVDQTRGWFYTLLVISTILFDKAPFKNCIVLGHVNDKDGFKMSKHKGNVIDPWTVLDRQGADAVRWYFSSNSAPWLPAKFYEEAVSEAQRNYCGTLWNAYGFFVLYADIDKYNPANYQLHNCKLTKMDLWILSKMHSLNVKIDECLANYQITEAARLLQNFVDQLSNWYIRRARNRFWGKDMTEDKIAAFTTLYTVLVNTAKLTAPFTPFIAELIYQNLVPNFFPMAEKSVHLTSFPQAERKWINKNLEIGMDNVLKIVSLARTARNTSNIKNRQPLKEMILFTVSPMTVCEDLQEVILDELNIKEFHYGNNVDVNNFITYKLKPQLKTLGPKYGNKLNAIRSFLTTCDATKVLQEIKEKGKFVTILDNSEVEIVLDDLLISTENVAGFACASDSDAGMTVALNIEIDEKLYEEGLIRELISKIQTMRKETTFAVTDVITVYYQCSDAFAHIIQKNSTTIKEAVLAKHLYRATIDVEYTKTWEVNEHTIHLSIAI